MDKRVLEQLDKRYLLLEKKESFSPRKRLWRILIIIEKRKSMFLRTIFLNLKMKSRKLEVIWENLEMKIKYFFIKVELHNLCRKSKKINNLLILFIKGWEFNRFHLFTLLILMLKKKNKNNFHLLSNKKLLMCNNSNEKEIIVKQVFRAVPSVSNQVHHQTLNLQVANNLHSRPIIVYKNLID